MTGFPNESEFVAVGVGPVVMELVGGKSLDNGRLPSKGSKAVKSNTKSSKIMGSR